MVVVVVVVEDTVLVVVDGVVESTSGMEREAPAVNREMAWNQHITYTTYDS